MHILITGTSGFIGKSLAQALAPLHAVIGLSRQHTVIDGTIAVQGDFTTPEALRQLDAYPLDVVVHLAAVTGGCSEEDGLRVNVAGTHHLLRYAITRGCRKFVLASSIAAVGFQSVRFRPLQLPMPDEHPCLDRDGYGLSKYLMEEVIRYLARQDAGLDFIALRLASIRPDDQPPTPVVAGPLREWSIGGLAVMYLSDTVRALRLAVDAPHSPGVRIMNAVAGQACVAVPVPEIIRAWYGADAERIDLSHYEQPGHAYDPVYDITRIRQELGFIPERRVIP